MVRFIADGDDGKRLVGLGLEKGNIERLMQGKPIRVSGESINMPGISDIMIFYGETPQALYDIVKPFLHPTESKIIIDKQLDIKP